MLHMLNRAEDTSNVGERCDLCGSEVTVVRTVSDELGACSICTSCAELWTTYLMHNPRLPRRAD